jgi:hypothetical protein
MQPNIHLNSPVSGPREKAAFFGTQSSTNSGETAVSCLIFFLIKKKAINFNQNPLSIKKKTVCML